MGSQDDNSLAASSGEIISTSSSVILTGMVRFAGFPTIHSLDSQNVKKTLR